MFGWIGGIYSFNTTVSTSRSTTRDTTTTATTSRDTTRSTSRSTTTTFNTSSVTVEGPFFNEPQYNWQVYLNKGYLRWANSWVAQGISGTSYSTGGWTYYRDAYQYFHTNTYWYAIRREQSSTVSTSRSTTTTFNTTYTTSYSTSATTSTTFTTTFNTQRSTNYYA